MNDIQADLTKGLTMEVPYEAFSDPRLLWNLIRRNVATGIPQHALKLGNEAGVGAKLINLLNSFTNHAAFNAKGIVRDGEEPLDEVYSDFCKSLKFFLTLIDGQGEDAGKIKVTLGIQSKDPWDGLRITEQGYFWLSFGAYQSDAGSGFIYDLKGHEEEPEQVTGVGVKIAPEEIWVHETSYATGQVPSLVSMAEVEKQLNDILVKLGSKYPNIFFGEIAKQAATNIFDFSAWSGAQPPHVMVAKASIFVRVVPILPPVGDTEKRVKVFINLTAHGDYALNVNYQASEV